MVGGDSKYTQNNIVRENALLDKAFDFRKLHYKRTTTSQIFTFLNKLCLIHTKLRSFLF